MKLGLIPKMNLKKDSGFQAPPIPLDTPPKKVIDKNEGLEMKLRSNPTEEKGLAYTFTVAFSKTGTPEDWLTFETNLYKIFVGQGLTNGLKHYTIVHRLLQGEPLTEFERKAAIYQTETVYHLDSCLQAVCMHIFPMAALKQKKRHMHRVVQKPPSMNIWEYYVQCQELNHYLDCFHPFGNWGLMLSTDKVMEHLEFVILHSWQKQMILQGFNTVEQNMDEFLEYAHTKKFETGNTSTMKRSMRPLQKFTQEKTWK